MFGLVTGLISLLNGLMGYLDKKQLMDAGAAMAAAPNLQRALDAVREAQSIRAGVESGSLSDPDPFVRK